MELMLAGILLVAFAHGFGHDMGAGLIVAGFLQLVVWQKSA